MVIWLSTQDERPDSIVQVYQYDSLIGVKNLQYALP